MLTMECENYDVCEKIINEIDSVFDRDPDLSTFEIINVDESQTKNKSPVIHLENHLGLESWCVPHVYRHAHQIILTAAKKSPSNCHSSSCNNSSAYDSNEIKTKQQPTPHPFNHALVKYLNCALLINPDVATFWNCRRRLLQKDRLDIRSEFKFSAIVLSKKPKSNDAFFYRRWLYSFQSHESIDWTRELSLCERCASKSLSNYQAWAHRQWVLQKAPFLLQYELSTTERFIRKHIGDYSGYYHRQFVLRKMSEFDYFEHEPKSEGSTAQYASLIDYLLAIGFDDIRSDESATTTPTMPAWKTLMKVIVPERDIDNSSDNDTNKIKSFMYCMNVAAYDLKFLTELQELFGYREAFQCHRKAIVQFMADKCAEWSARTIIDVTSAGKSSDGDPANSINPSLSSTHST